MADESILSYFEQPWKRPWLKKKEEEEILYSLISSQKEIITSRNRINLIEARSRDSGLRQPRLLGIVQFYYYLKRK